ncbi:hypothetical protein [Pedobacter jejuensis]|uniref:Gliding motility-associated C-terminal domain-containing protein n=1 Tax=Pedobacter jejuensis TaxID=1268550 RepID=A0A3N0BVQ6_9SPHI|nr:hypothetical protein [Pedobacter jejuensis]RNL53410.1 hypothetical protein D7004_10030 [Pedobacter jejuensis]
MKALSSLLFSSIFFLNLSSNAQLTATVTTNTGGAANCDPRVITVVPSGGSGDYEYIYRVAPGQSGSVITQNTANYTVTPVPSLPTTYRISITDNVTLETVTKKVTVSPLLSGEFNVRIPNAFTPLYPDGVNDRWEVRNSGNNTSNASNFIPYPINAYAYELTIYSSNPGAIYYQASGSSTNPDSGISSLYGINTNQIYWDGTIPFNGGRVLGRVGTYYYTLKLYNCSYPSGKVFQGYIQLGNSPH